MQHSPLCHRGSGVHLLLALFVAVSGAFVEVSGPIPRQPPCSQDQDQDATDFDRRLRTGSLSLHILVLLRGPVTARAAQTSSHVSHIRCLNVLQVAGMA